MLPMNSNRVPEAGPNIASSHHLVPQNAPAIEASAAMTRTPGKRTKTTYGLRVKAFGPKPLLAYPQKMIVRDKLMVPNILPRRSFLTSTLHLVCSLRSIRRGWPTQASFAKVGAADPADFPGGSISQGDRCGSG